MPRLGARSRSRSRGRRSPRRSPGRRRAASPLRGGRQTPQTVVQLDMVVTAQVPETETHLPYVEVERWLRTRMHGSAKTPEDVIVADLAQGSIGHPYSVVRTALGYCHLRVVFHMLDLRDVEDPMNWVLQRVGTMLVHVWNSDAGTIKYRNEVGKLVLYDLEARIQHADTLLLNEVDNYPTPNALQAVGVNPDHVPWAYKDY